METPQAIDPKQSMTSRTWVTLFLSIIVLAIPLNFALAWKVDSFGLLRDTHGRAIHTSRHERKAKYFLNYYYVPANFDALIVGTSTSISWKLEDLKGYRFYNESLLGADGVEENLYVEKALERGHFKVALISISRGLTDRSDLQDGLDGVTRREALGSLYSYIMMLDRVLHPKSLYGSDGTWQILGTQPGPVDVTTAYPTHPIDTKSFDAYRTLTRDLIAHGTRVMYFISPHFGLEQPDARQVIRKYDDDILAGLPPAPVIDFNAQSYTWLNSDPKYFIDEDHLSPLGAEVVSRIVNQKLHDYLKD